MTSKVNLLSTKMVAARLGVTTVTVMNYVRRGLLKPVLDGPFVFTAAEVKRFMAEAWPRLRPAGGVKRGTKGRGSAL